jgi:Predicted nucleoside-diphosphate sugar epimerase
MRVFITGGTGLIGTLLVKALLVQNHKITVLSRDVVKAKTKAGIRCRILSIIRWTRFVRWL